MYILTQKSGIALYVLRGHKDYISSLVLVEEKLYSSGFDQTIRMWNIPLSKIKISDTNN